MRVEIVSIVSLVAAGAANAQGAGATSEVVQGATPGDLIAFFQAAEIEAKDITESKDLQGASSVRTLEVNMGEGAVFYVGLLGCDSKTAAARCELVMPYVVFGSLNFPLARINAFNFSDSTLSTMMMTEEGAIMMSARFNMAGGVTKKNLFTNIAVFVSDIESAVNAIQKGGASGSTISFRPAGDGANRGLGLEIPTGTKVNWIGKATKNLDSKTIQKLRHIGQAQ